jgi:hypothetical protein
MTDSTTRMPKLPAGVFLPLDISAISTSVLCSIVALLLSDWQAGLSSFLAGLASWMHLRLLLASLGQMQPGKLYIHLLWVLIRLALLGGVVVGLLILIPGYALAVIAGLVTSALAGLMGIIISLMRLNKTS